jgi:hypothetical protein
MDALSYSIVREAEEPVLRYIQLDTAHAPVAALPEHYQKLIPRPYLRKMRVCI